MLKSEFERQGIPIELYTMKRIQRRNLPLSSETFIAGDMDAMHGAMSQLKIDIPAPDDYPDSLIPFLHRSVWKATLDEIERGLVDQDRPPVFVKPSARRKNFTGRVFGSLSDFAYIGAVSRRQEVWCSDVVAWRSEYRVYTIDDEIVGVDHYAGEPDVGCVPDRGRAVLGSVDEKVAGAARAEEVMTGVRDEMGLEPRAEWQREAGEVIRLGNIVSAEPTTAKPPDRTRCRLSRRQPRPPHGSAGMCSSLSTCSVPSVSGRAV